MKQLKKIIQEMIVGYKQPAKKSCSCGCNTCDTDKAKPMSLNENMAPKEILSEGLKYHMDKKQPLTENVYRAGSTLYFNLWSEARALYSRGIIEVQNQDDLEILTETHLGEFGLLEDGSKVPLDFIMEEIELDEAKDKKKTPPIGKPKRGGSKKFYVYVRDKGKIKKVSFGDTSGLSAKINNPEARRAFAARHDCKNKKDRTKASYWSCRLPRYAKLLGLKSNFSGFW
jgi:hypothetical protein